MCALGGQRQLCLPCFMVSRFKSEYLTMGIDSMRLNNDDNQAGSLFSYCIDKRSLGDVKFNLQPRIMAGIIDRVDQQIGWEVHILKIIGFG